VQKFYYSRYTILNQLGLKPENVKILALGNQSSTIFHGGDYISGSIYCNYWIILIILEYSTILKVLHYLLALIIDQIFKIDVFNAVCSNFVTSCILCCRSEMKFITFPLLPDCLQIQRITNWFVFASCSKSKIYQQNYIGPWWEWKLLNWKKHISCTL
jgi:hypothetical protein